MSPIHVLKAWNATDSPTLYSEVVEGRTPPGEQGIIWDTRPTQSKPQMQKKDLRHSRCGTAPAHINT